MNGDNPPQAPDGASDTESVEPTGDAEVVEAVEVEELESDAVEAIIDVVQQERDAAQEKVRQLTTELGEEVARRQRAHADFANYQRRAVENEQRARDDGRSAVIRPLINVLDHFDLALGHSTDAMTVESLLSGMQIVRTELGKVLEQHGVTVVRPVVGDAFDPSRHQALMRMAAPGVAPGCVCQILQVGYMRGDHLLRPAGVAVASE